MSNLDVWGSYVKSMTDLGLVPFSLQDEQIKQVRDKMRLETTDKFVLAELAQVAQELHDLGVTREANMTRQIIKQLEKGPKND